MKTKLTLCLLTFSISAVMAQQYSPRTHFYQNSLVYNPAISGTEDEVPIRLNFRQQWSGLDDAPSSQTLSSHAFVGKNVGLGLTIFNDIAGPSRNTGLQASAARHFALDKEGKRWFSFGLSLLLYQYKFDTDRLRTDIPNDPAVLAMAKQNSRLTPDVGAGVYLSDQNGFVGISCLNMVQNKYDLLDHRQNPNTVVRTYYLIGGYRFPVNPDLSIEPAALIRVTEAKVWQADIMAKVNYDKYWAGLAYRTSDAVAILLGMRIDLFSFGYSYDYPVSGIGNFNKGSHEITATVFLFNAISRQGPMENVQPGKKGSFNRAPKRRRPPP